MSYSNDIPKTGVKNGEERYFIHLNDYESFFSKKKSYNDIIFSKVKCIRRFYDKENEKWVIQADVLENYLKQEYGSIYIDNNWQLQKTKQAAQRLLIVIAMNYSKHLCWEENPPI